MANKVTVSLVGVASLDRHFSFIKGAVTRKVRDVVTDSATKIMTDARLRAPVRKLGKVIGGRLRSSIRIDFLKDGLAASIGTNVEYAAFVEFGTGRRGASPFGTKGVGPLPPGYVFGMKPGMYAQPYLWPAFEAERAAFLRNLARAIEEGSR